LDRKLSEKLNSLSNPWVLKVKEDSLPGSTILYLKDVDLLEGFLKNSSFKTKAGIIQQRRIVWNTKTVLIFTPPLVEKISAESEIELFFIPYLDEELRSLRCEWTRIGGHEKYYVSSGQSWAVDGVQVDGLLWVDGEVHSFAEVSGTGVLRGKGIVYLH